MHVRVVQGAITDMAVDAVIVNLFEGVTEPGGATGAVNGAIDGLIGHVIQRGEFKGKANETIVLHVQNQPFEKIVLVGLGNQEDWQLEGARQASATAVKAALKGKARKVATIIHGAGIGGLDVAEAAQAVTEGALLATYKYDTYKTDAAEDETDSDADDVELIVVELDEGKIEQAETGVKHGVIMAESTRFARDLVNAPGNEVTPTELARRAQAMAEEVGLECTVLDRDAMAELGMGSLLGVAQGSAQPPKLVLLRYRGSDDEQPLALVGKGVTFDTGGISIKPAAGMDAMKSDMAGAAGVLGAMRAIALLQPKQHVIAVAACVENMPSGTALKPGDIVKAMNGKTIEIDNTDAEGRLILADAVAYAESQGAHTIIDAATLTGAVSIALGDVYTAIIGNDDDLVAEVQAAGDKVGERYWQLPSHPDYKQQYKSDWADIRNTGGRPAGTITGALIIGEFVKDARWAHLDIAATAWTSQEKHYMTKGATGVAVRTLARWVCDR